MAHVNLTIAGRSYRMACEEGEEHRLTELALRFDRTVAELRERIGEIGDRRLAVMAGLLIVDDLDDTEQRLARAEAEVLRLKAEMKRVEEAARATPRPPAEPAATVENRRAKIRLATRSIDEVAKSLNRSAHDQAN